MPVKNTKFLLRIGVGVLCALVVTAGVFFFWQQDRSYRIHMDDLNRSANDPGYVTIDSHQFGPLIKQYKSPYMGDAVNMRGLFDNLLLVRAGVNIALAPDTYTLQVYYQTTEEELNPANVHVALVYNSVAAFTLIDNLQHIEYYFPGNGFVYTISRESVQEWFSEKDLAAYFPDETTWKNKFQDLMKESSYREDFFTVAFVQKHFNDPDYDGNDATAAAGVDPSSTGHEGTDS